jgi:hypothetical protein
MGSRRLVCVARENSAFMKDLPIPIRAIERVDGFLAAFPEQIRPRTGESAISGGLRQRREIKQTRSTHHEGRNPQKFEYARHISISRRT